MCNPIYYAWVGTYWWYCFSYHIIIDCPSSSLLFQINKCTIFTYLFRFNFNKKIRSVHSRGEMAFSISICGQPVNPLVHGKDSYQVPRVQIQFMLFVPFYFIYLFIIREDCTILCKYIACLQEAQIQNNIGPKLGRVEQAE